LRLLSKPLEKGSANSRPGLLVIVGAIFYIGWFGAVYFAKWGHPAASVLFPIALLAFQIWKKILKPKKIYWAIAIATFGAAFDGLMLYSGQLVSPLTYSIIPVWLISLWFLFSFSMMSLGVRFALPIWLLSLMGAVFGPLSYKSGEIFDVLKFSSESAIWIYGLFWMFIFPGVVLVSQYREIENPSI
jgi:hypothetical protein